MLKKFWLKLSLFALPFILWLAFPVFVLTVSGELLPVSVVLSLNDGSPEFRYGLAYSNADKYYKIAEARRRKPAVLALGTSRIMQLRSEFFSPPQQFYNAGGGVTRLEQFRVFLARAGYAPRILIAGLDQNFFNDNWKVTKYEDYAARLAADERAGLGTIFMGWRGIYRDYRSGKFRLSDLRAFPQCIGVSACAQRKGFRADGSYDYGTKPSGKLAARLQEAFERIETRTELFELGDKVSAARLAELRQLLAYCRAHNIQVVGFLPPYAHAVYERMMALGNYQYLSQIAGRVRPIFEQYNFTFADYSDLALLGVDDAEVIDGWHGNEQAYRRILLKLAEKDAQLAQYMPALSLLSAEQH
jgi:hypothetical protein